MSSLSKLGLGYSIAIALAFLFLLSLLLLSFYVFCRSRSRSRSQTLIQSSTSITPSISGGNGIILPRIVFVAEDDDDGDEGNGVVGLDQSVINSYPKFPFSKEKIMTNCICSICLCEYKEMEMLRMMPDCRHFFHLCCVDAWLKLNGSCPVCRSSPLPTPVSTPLQEVVPLSQYMADRRRR